MSSDPASEQSSRPLFHPPWPGYWITKRRLNRLVRFKDLIIHREQWAPEIESAPSLEELFPSEHLQRGTMDAIQRIEREIRESMMLVTQHLRQCGVGTGVVITRFNRLENRRETTNHDLVLDYFRMSNDDELDRHRNFEELVERLDMGIGLHKNRLPHAKHDLFNPIMWMAYVIRLPITVLERAGMMSHPKNQEKFLNVYAWVVQFAMLALILMVAGHYGAKIAWGDIFSYVIKAIPGMK